MDTPPSIVHVPFNGQTIDVIAGERPDAYFVALKPLCENIGVAFNAQFERLKRQPWATIRMTRTVGADGKSREMASIDRQTLVMWLATIDTSRLKSERAKQLVMRYQLECASALDSYFSNGFAVTPATAERIINDPDTFIRVLTEMKAQRARADQLAAENSRMLPQAHMAASFIECEGTYTITDAAKLLRQVDPAMSRHLLFQLLRRDRMVEVRTNKATATAIQRGYLVNVATSYTDPNGVLHAHDIYARATPKGVSWMSDRYCSHFAQPALAFAGEVA